jgi:tRNA(Ile)-lysidine synthase
MNKVVIPTGRYIVAVSGGVDSVALLDMLSRQSELDLIVAHFDHGIREDSVRDAEFVASLAAKYGLKFETKREELGGSASEELARERRYKFLRSVAGKYNARIITAHHADDVIETIAINLLRGTGWRGLAVMDSDIIRPLTNMTKSEILGYAKQNKLVWQEDITNVDDKYLRNKVRQQTINLDNDTKLQLLALWSEQKVLKKQIDDVIKETVRKDSTYSRNIFTDLDWKVGMEILRYITDARLTRPQMIKVLRAIKTFLPGKVCQAGGGVEIKFTSRNFTIKLIK